MKYLFIILILISSVVSGQRQFDEDLEKAYVNAKKGIDFALSNIPYRKSSLTKELISNDQLISRVKLSKEVNGVSIESTGYYKTYEVKIIIYRSYDKLIEEGIIKSIPEDD